MKHAQKSYPNTGWSVIPKKASTKTVNLYEIVKEAAEKFGLPMPKIIVSKQLCQMPQHPTLTLVVG